MFAFECRWTSDRPRLTTDELQLRKTRVSTWLANTLTSVREEIPDSARLARREDRQTERSVSLFESGRAVSRPRGKHWNLESLRGRRSNWFLVRASRPRNRRSTDPNYKRPPVTGFPSGNGRTVVCRCWNLYHFYFRGTLALRGSIEFVCHIVVHGRNFGAVRVEIIRADWNEAGERAKILSRACLVVFINVRWRRSERVKRKKKRETEKKKKRKKEECHYVLCVRERYPLTTANVHRANGT